MITYCGGRLYVGPDLDRPWAISFLAHLSTSGGTISATAATPEAALLELENMLRVAIGLQPLSAAPVGAPTSEPLQQQHQPQSQPALSTHDPEK